MKPMMRVMIVDDEKMIRDGLAHLIDWQSFNCDVVAEAADGVAALEYLQDHPIDLVFTDIRMPRLDGMEFARQLRAGQPWVKVVFVTGASMFRSISPESFKVVADYNDIKANPSDKCTIRIIAVPHGVKNARPEIESVDYLIEEQ